MKLTYNESLKLKFHIQADTIISSYLCHGCCFELKQLPISKATYIMSE